MDPQFQEAFKICKQRYTDFNMDNEDSMSTEDNNSSDSDSNSEEDPYDKNFFYRTNDRSSRNQSMINQRYRSDLEIQIIRFKTNSSLAAAAKF